MRAFGIVALFVAILSLDLSVPIQAQGTKDKDGKDIPGDVGGKSFAQWLAELKSTDPATRQHAVRMVVMFGAESKKAVPNLVAALQDSDATVKADAAAALGMMQIPPSDVALVVKGLSGAISSLEDQRTVRLQTVFALGKLGAAARPAIPMVAKCANDTRSWEVRKAGCFALGQIDSIQNQEKNKGPESATVGALIRCLSDHSSAVKMEAIYALSSIGVSVNAQEAAAEKRALETLLSDKDRSIGIWARTLLMYRDYKTYGPTLSVTVKMLHKDPEMRVRAQAAKAIGALGPKAKPAIADLLEAVNDKDLEVIIAAIQAIGMLGDTAATGTDTLAKLLNDPELAVRCQAAQSLGAMGSGAKNKVPDLIKCLSDKENRMIMAAIVGLANIGKDSETAIPAIEELTTHKDADIKRTATDAVSYIKEQMRKK